LLLGILGCGGLRRDEDTESGDERTGRGKTPNEDWSHLDVPAGQA
jgi:hypothetical protein